MTRNARDTRRLGMSTVSFWRAGGFASAVGLLLFSAGCTWHLHVHYHADDKSVQGIHRFSSEVAPASGDGGRGASEEAGTNGIGQPQTPNEIIDELLGGQP